MDHTFHPDAAEPVSVDDLAALAAAKLPRDVWDFVDGGSGAELTLRANRSALDRVYVVPRVLTDVAVRITSTTLLGGDTALPLAVAPMAYQRLVHPDGELATARAARAAGVPFAVSTFSSVAVEEIAALGGTVWFQLYWLLNRSQVRDLIARAEEAGCAALMLTVDAPVLGPRRRDARNAFTLPSTVVAAGLGGRTGASHRRVTGRSAVAAHTEAVFDPTLSWSDVAWLRERTSLPLALKGVLDPDDAGRAADLGVDAVVVSNHGGRQLDGAIASADAIGPICAEVAGRCEVLLDSGVRSGMDILKAVALGASGVLVGRPVLWGLAVGGESGVARVLSLLRADLDTALALTGCPNLDSARRLRTVRRG